MKQRQRALFFRKFLHNFHHRDMEIRARVTTIPDNLPRIWCYSEAILAYQLTLLLRKDINAAD